MVTKIDQERFVGFRVRRKRTTEGEARPTMACVLSGSKKKSYKLDDDDAELDWVRGVFPIKMRKVERDEDLSKFAAHHVKWRKLKKTEKASDFPTNLLRSVGKQFFVATKVPASYEGLQPGDVVGMVLGGSGDLFASALSRRSEDIGADVFRIAPFKLKDLRPKDKEEDAENLALLVRDRVEEFQRMTPRDRKMIRVRELLRLRTFAMKDRIGCEQRLLQSMNGRVFCSEDGHYPEGSLKLQFEELKASDIIVQSMTKEEARYKRELTKAVEAMDVYQELFGPIKGVGPMIAARLICAIQDVRRFEDHIDAATGKLRQGKAKLKSFCGAAPRQGGVFGDQPFEKQFPRRRHGSVANWHPEARQALYLLGDQFNRRPETKWGRKLLEYKAKLRKKYPEPVVVTNAKGKEIKRFTDGHIHRMATWKTLSKFVEWLWTEWTALEKRVALSQREAA